MSKRYLVILQNVCWNNLEYIGEYDKLEDALPDINMCLPDGYEINELFEYAGTFGYQFDKEVLNKEDEDDEVYMVRGFILKHEEAFKSPLVDGRNNHE